MLSERVLYRKYAGYSYILNMNTSKSYVFDGISNDIILYIANEEKTDIDSIMFYLREHQAIPDLVSFKDDVENFLTFLKSEGIF